MKTIFKKFDKKRITALPVVHFEGRIVVVISAGEAEKAVDYLLTQPILGVDTETRPSFKKGQIHKVALLQVSTHDTCFLFRLNYLGMAPAIVRLLEDVKVPKVGLSWHDDILQLHKRAEFTPGNFIDLQKHVGEIGVEDRSLQKLYANFFGQRISKSQQLSNWENDVLQEKQKTIEKQVAKPLSWWQQMQMWLGRVVLVAIAAMAGIWIVRKKTWWLGLFKRK